MKFIYAPLKQVCVIDERHLILNNAMYLKKFVSLYSVNIYHSYIFNKCFELFYLTRVISEYQTIHERVFIEIQTKYFP